MKSGDFWFAVAFFGAIFASLAWLLIGMYSLSKKVDGYLLAMGDAREHLNAATEELRDFEADGYAVKVLEDGQIQLNFTHSLGKTEYGTLTRTRTVIMHAGLWTQVTAEAALKTAFRAARKSTNKPVIEHPVDEN